VTILFVGERRSAKAKRMGVWWEDGRLAAKQLFDALVACGVDPGACRYTNWFERGGKRAVREHAGPVVALGKKVQTALAARGLAHVAMVHPAARGRIRKKERYIEHVRSVLVRLALGDSPGPGDQGADLGNAPRTQGQPPARRTRLATHPLVPLPDGLFAAAGR
jgi:hypothetical protein